MLELLRKLRASGTEDAKEDEEESDEEDGEAGTLELPPGVDLGECRMLLPSRAAH